MPSQRNRGIYPPFPLFLLVPFYRLFRRAVRQYSGCAMASQRIRGIYPLFPSIRAMQRRRGSFIVACQPLVSRCSSTVSRCSSLGPLNASAEGIVSRCSSTVRFSLLVDGFSFLVAMRQYSGCAMASQMIRGIYPLFPLIRVMRRQRGSFTVARQSLVSRCSSTVSRCSLLVARSR